MDEQLTTEEQARLREIYRTGHSDWYTSRAHAALMREDYTRYGWQVAEVHREHDKALMELGRAIHAGLSLAEYQAESIILRWFDSGLSAA